MVSENLFPPGELPGTPTTTTTKQPYTLFNMSGKLGDGV